MSEFKGWRCNQCSKEERRDVRNPLWIRVEGRKDFCSYECLVKWGSEEARKHRVEAAKSGVAYSTTTPMPDIFGPYVVSSENHPPPAAPHRPDTWSYGGWPKWMTRLRRQSP